MSTEYTRRRKFTQFMSHHILSNEHRYKLIPVMHSDCMPDKIG